MKKEIKEIVKIPEGIELEVKDRVITMKKGGQEVAKKVSNEFEIKKEAGNLVLFHSQATKKEKKLIKTAAAHLRSAIEGLNEKYLYQLKVCFVHFPISVELQGKEILIKNFLGERVPRKAKILDDVEVKIDKDMITITSHNKEKAGQTAANIEKATRIRYRDRRVFQDGIFIVNKPKGKRQ